jgi:plasmid stabilization system protein ParE
MENGAAPDPGRDASAVRSLRVRPAADRELEEAFNWYRERSPATADRFMNETGVALELIERFSEAGANVPGVDDPSIRRRPIHNFPFHVVYLLLGDRIEVLAFAHDRRRPDYWRSRRR